MDLVFNLTGSDEGFVNAFSVGGYIVVVTVDHVYAVDAGSMRLAANLSIARGKVWRAVYDGEGRVYLAVYIPASQTTKLYRFDAASLRLHVLASLYGFPWSLGALNGSVVVVVHDFSREAVFVYGFTGGGNWSYEVPGRLISPNYIGYINVTMSPKGYTAVYVDGKVYESFIVFNRTGRVVYNYTVDTGVFVQPYAEAAWSPGGDALAFVVYSGGGDYALKLLNTTTMKTVWTIRVAAPANPPWGLVFNPTGCCVYYQVSDARFLVINATNGEVVGSIDWPIYTTRMYAWTASGAWGILAQEEGLHKFGLAGMLGGITLSFEYSPLNWVINNRMIVAPPGAAGFLSDGSIWLVQHYGSKVRVAVVRWPGYAVAYFRPGDYGHYFTGITVSDPSGAQWNDWAVPLYPVGAATLTYKFHAKTKLPVETALGELGYIVGDPRVAESVEWRASLNVEPLHAYLVNVEGNASKLLTHYIFKVPEPCSLKRLVISWGNDSYTVNDTGRREIVVAALTGAYNVTAVFKQDNIMFGTIEPTTLTLTATGGETQEILLKPQAIVLWLKGENHAYIKTGSGKLVRLITTENWTGYCLAPGNYTLIVRPSAVGAILAPKNWNVTLPVSGKGKIIRVDTDKLLEDRLSTLNIINNAREAYTLLFYVKTGEGYKPLIGHIIPGGHTLTLKIIVGFHYKAVYEKKGSNTPEGTVEFESLQPGQNITIRIPTPTRATHTTTTTTTSTPPAPAHTSTAKPQKGAAGSATTAHAEGGKQGRSKTLALALGAGLIVVLAILALALRR